MKIISVDNYNREDRADELICENVHECIGEKIVELLNNDPRRYDNAWYRLVKDDHRLWRGMEELI